MSNTDANTIATGNIVAGIMGLGNNQSAAGNGLTALNAANPNQSQSAASSPGSSPTTNNAPAAVVPASVTSVVVAGANATAQHQAMVSLVTAQNGMVAGGDLRPPVRLLAALRMAFAGQPHVLLHSYGLWSHVLDQAQQLTTSPFANLRAMKIASGEETPHVIATTDLLHPICLEISAALVVADLMLQGVLPGDPRVNANVLIAAQRAAVAGPQVLAAAAGVQAAATAGVGQQQQQQQAAGPVYAGFPVGRGGGHFGRRQGFYGRGGPGGRGRGGGRGGHGPAGRGRGGNHHNTNNNNNSHGGSKSHSAVPDK